jgi:hypothetical protein
MAQEEDGMRNKRYLVTCCGIWINWHCIMFHLSMWSR